MTGFWAARSGRERRLLLALAVVGLPVLIWLLLLRPLDAARARAEVRLAAALADRDFLAGAKAALDAAPAASAEPLTVRVQTATSAAGLTLASLDPAGAGSLTARIAAARAPVLLRLVATLEAEGLLITALSVSRNDDASVSAQFTVAEPGR